MNPQNASPSSAFQTLKPKCVRLSEVALQLRAGAPSLVQVQQAANDLLQTLRTLLADGVLISAKLAEYVFFPLSHLFQDRLRLTDSVVETAIQCLDVLLLTGWRTQIDGDLALQLMLLLTFLASGSASANDEQRQPPSEEVLHCTTAALGHVMEAIGQCPNARQKLVSETNLPALGHTLVVLLETARDSPNTQVQLTALGALESLGKCLKYRQLHAQFLPGVVSSLTRLLTPGTKQNKPSKVLAQALRIMRLELLAVLSDHLAPSDELNDSWHKATASQVKLALANLFRLHSSTSKAVQSELGHLCMAILQDMPQSLQDSTSMAIETLLILCHSQNDPSLASQFEQVVLSSDDFTEAMKSSLYFWVESLPRMMISNDEQARQRTMNLISQSFRLLQAGGADMSLLDNSLLVNMQSSLEHVLDIAAKAPPRLNEVTSLEPTTTSLGKVAQAQPVFPSIISSTLKQKGTTDEILMALRPIATSEHAGRMVSECLDMARSCTGKMQAANLWLAVNILRERQNDDSEAALSAFTNLESSVYVEYDDLYSLALSILSENSSEPTAVQLQALALEAVTLQSLRQGEEFRPELVDALYPVLHHLGSASPLLQNHAVISLNSMAASLGYHDARELITANSDYLVNAIGAKLNAFDLEPQVPMVLHMAIRLVGPTLVPYLDDVVDGMFECLDEFHGYPSLVRLLFSALGSVVEECVKSKAFTQEYKAAPCHRKNTRRRTILDLAADLKARRQRREARQKRDAELDAVLPDKTPQQPWGDLRPGSGADADPPSDAATTPSDDKDKDKEAPLSGSYKCALRITRAALPHLASPSPGVRSNLLTVIKTAAPLLAQHEDSFLPFVADSWPLLMRRLGDTEVYVVCSALDTLSALCEGAGDFVIGRIKAAWPDLEKLWSLTVTHKSQDTSSGSTTASAITSRDLASIMSDSSSEPLLTAADQNKSTGGLLTAVQTRHFGQDTSRHVINTPSYTPTTIVRLKSSLVDLFLTLTKYLHLPILLDVQMQEWLASCCVLNNSSTHSSQSATASTQQLTKRATTEPIQMNSESQRLADKIESTLRDYNPLALSLVDDLRHGRRRRPREEEHDPERRRRQTRWFTLAFDPITGEAKLIRIEPQPVKPE